MSQHATVDIHPEGDVVLICGEGEHVKYVTSRSRTQISNADLHRRLRVSSVLLSHASPVFKAMLGPHFKEGSTLATSSSIEIPLPEDDPFAMEIICYVLHMRNWDAASEIDADLLLRIADHCDYYNVLVATRSAINLWLDDCLETDMSCETGVELLSIAFKLKLWIPLSRLGVIVVREAWDDISVPRNLGAEDSELPFYIFGN